MYPEMAEGHSFSRIASKADIVTCNMEYFYYFRYLRYFRYLDILQISREYFRHNILCGSSFQRKAKRINTFIRRYSCVKGFTTAELNSTQLQISCSVRLL